MAISDVQTERRFTQADWTDFAHTGPGTLAGEYLRRFWQPIYASVDLPPGRAVPIRVMSEDFTLYRGAGGTAHLLAFRCAHRGTQLSTGWVEGDDLRCFYHGWKYDPSGQCVEQPAEPEPFCQKIRIRSYPVQEYLGLIFAYLGPGEPPALPRFPLLEQEGVVDNRVQALACNYFNRIDNAADPVHTAFVHYFRRVGSHFRPGHVPLVFAEETDWGFTTVTRWPDDLSGENPIHHFVMPNAFLIRIEGDDARGIREHCSWRVPIDDEHHLSLNASLLLISGEAAERYRERQRARGKAERSAPDEQGEAVLAGRLSVHDLEDQGNLYDVQDYVAQVGQGRLADRARERLGRVDAGVVALRKIWARELGALAKGQPIRTWRPEALGSTTEASPGLQSILVGHVQPVGRRGAGSVDEP